MKQQPNETEKFQKEIQKVNISKYVQETMEELRETISLILPESTVLQFIVHPSEFLNLLPEIYRKHPELKVPTKLRRK